MAPCRVWDRGEQLLAVPGWLEVWRACHSDKYPETLLAHFLCATEESEPAPLPGLPSTNGARTTGGRDDHRRSPDRCVCPVRCRPGWRLGG